MAKRESLLMPLVQKLILRSAPALLGDALLLGFIWIALGTGLHAMLQAKLQDVSNHITASGLHELAITATVAGIVELVARGCGILALGLLVVGSVNLHAELSATTRQE